MHEDLLSQAVDRNIAAHALEFGRTHLREDFRIGMHRQMGLRHGCLRGDGQRLTWRGLTPFGTASELRRVQPRPQGSSGILIERGNMSQEQFSPHVWASCASWAAAAWASSTWPSIA